MQKGRIPFLKVGRSVRFRLPDVLGKTQRVSCELREVGEVSLTLRSLPTLLTDCVIVGHARKADVVFTPRQWFAICVHMMNENPANFFLMPYRDKNGQPKYAKAFRADAEKRMRGLGTQSPAKQNRRDQLGFIPPTQSEKHAGPR